MTDVLVERSFDPPLSGDDARALDRSIGACLDLHQVEWRASFLSRNRRRMICHFEAPDAESVRIVFRLTGVKLDGLWAVTVHEASELAAADAAADTAAETTASLGADRIKETATHAQPDGTAETTAGPDAIAETNAVHVLGRRSFHEPLSWAQLRAAEHAQAAELRSQGVQLVRQYFSRDHQRLVDLYRAPDLESVRSARRRAGTPLDQVWEYALADGCWPPFSSPITTLRKSPKLVGF